MSVFPHSRLDGIAAVRTGRHRLLLLDTRFVGPDTDAIGHAAVLRIPDIVIYIQLDLLAHQCGRLGVAEQLPQRLAVGGVYDQRAYLQDAGDTLFLEGKNVLVFFAALQGHRSVPQAGNGEHRLCAVIDVLGTQVLGFAHLAETFIAGQLAQFIFRHHVYFPPSGRLRLE